TTGHCRNVGSGNHAAIAAGPSTLGRPPRFRSLPLVPSGFEGILLPRPHTTYWGYLSQADTHLPPFLIKLDVSSIWLKPWKAAMSKSLPKIAWCHNRCWRCLLSLHVIIRFEPLPGKAAEFREQLLRVNGPSRAEPGCLAIDVFVSIREPFAFAVH